MKWIDERLGKATGDDDFFSYAQGEHWLISVHVDEKELKPTWEIQICGKVITRSESSLSFEAAKHDAITQMWLFVDDLKKEFAEKILGEQLTDEELRSKCLQETRADWDANVSGSIVGKHSPYQVAVHLYGQKVADHLYLENERTFEQSIRP
jgi:hypothetical protein